MIGQQELLTTLQSITNKIILIVGCERGGKKTLLKELFNNNRSYLIEKTTVDSIKSVYDALYTDKFIYLGFADIDKSNINAQNLLLKLIEDAFINNCTIFLTCSNISKIPATIISRCEVYHMRPYSKEELLQYSSNIDYCTTIGDIVELETYNIKEFKEFINKIVNNVQNISLANFFKIEQQIKLTKTNNGYDLFLVLNGICEESLKRQLYKLYIITSNYINQLSTINISKKQLLWNWIIEVKENYNELS